jgi:hypothetical protein
MIARDSERKFVSQRETIMGGNPEAELEDLSCFLGEVNIY